MALYEFQCSACQHDFTAFRPMAEVATFGKVDKAVKCPECGKKKAIRILSEVSGWDANPEPWHYDYVQHAKPKYVKDNKGNRQKYDPNKHQGGRKGQG